ncbi:hypothetical protein Tco_0915082 [Tanacetum coccineum]
MDYTRNQNEFPPTGTQKQTIARLQDVNIINCLGGAKSELLVDSTNGRINFSDFAAVKGENMGSGLSQLWEVLYSRVAGHRLLISELNVFGGPLAMQCDEFLKQLSQTEVLNMLEIRKTIAEVHIQVHKKIDFLTVMRIVWMGGGQKGETIHLVMMSAKASQNTGWGRSGRDEGRRRREAAVVYRRACGGDARGNIRGGSVANTRTVRRHPRLQSKKSAMDSSFTLVSTKETGNVKILQSCMVCFCVVVWGGLFLITDDIGSSEFTIYEMMIGCSVWMVRYRVDTDDFMTPLSRRLVVQYNLVSKTFHKIYDCGFNQLDDNHDDDDDDDELLQQFQAEHNVYEFISSFTSV